MDVFIFVILILALAGGWYLLNRMDKRTKNKHKMDAYRLLDTPTASKQEIKQTIKMLRLYGGRFRKDKEFIQLVNKLIDRLDKMDELGTAQSR
jgi:hypothetical protein